jgi:hypothetical protein
MMATLYDASVPAINQHLKRIFADDELGEVAVIKHYLTTASDGKTYQVKHYNLQAIIAVDFKFENERTVNYSARLPSFNFQLCHRHTRKAALAHLNHIRTRRNLKHFVGNHYAIDTHPTLINVAQRFTGRWNQPGLSEQLTNR